MSKKWPADIHGSLVMRMSPGLSLPSNRLVQGLAGGGQRVDVAGRAGDGLGDHAAARVEQAAGQVAGLAHDRAEGDPLQRLGLLADDADQVRPEDFELDAVHAHAPVRPSPSTQPIPSTTAVPARRQDDGGLALLDDRRAVDALAHAPGRRGHRPAPGRRSAQSGIVRSAFGAPGARDGAGAASTAIVRSLGGQPPADDLDRHVRGVHAVLRQIDGLERARGSPRRRGAGAGRGRSVTPTSFCWPK